MAHVVKRAAVTYQLEGFLRYTSRPVMLLREYIVNVFNDLFDGANVIAIRMYFAEVLIEPLQDSLLFEEIILQTYGLLLTEAALQEVCSALLIILVEVGLD